MHNAKSNQFSSRLGFIMAAAGSAVGVGNIWGFPTQAASNGGGAFLPCLSSFDLSAWLPYVNGRIHDRSARDKRTLPMQWLN